MQYGNCYESYLPLLERYHCILLVLWHPNLSSHKAAAEIDCKQDVTSRLADRSRHLWFIRRLFDRLNHISRGRSRPSRPATPAATLPSDEIRGFISRRKLPATDTNGHQTVWKQQRILVSCRRLGRPALKIDDTLAGSRDFTRSLIESA